MLRVILSSAPMFACAFWFLALLTDFRHTNRAKVALTVFMFVATIHFFCQAEFCSLEYRLTGLIDPLYILVTLSVFPLYYIYIKVLTTRGNPTLRSLWIFLPALLISGVSLVLYAEMSPGETDAYVHEGLYNERGSYEFSAAGRLLKYFNLLFDITFAAIIPPVAYFGYKRIAAYNKLLKEYYSNQEGKMLTVVKGMFYAFMATSVFSAIFNAVGRDFFTQPVDLLFIPSLMFVGLLFMLGLTGFRQDFTIDDVIKEQMKHAEVAPEQELTEQGKELRMMQLKNKLIKLMSEEAPYKNPYLCINDLAVQMCCNRTYISRVINQYCQTNFSEFVNTYRIEHAKQLLLQSHEKEIAISLIANSSGFSSESSFFRCFNNIEGMSPKRWKEINSSIK